MRPQNDVADYHSIKDVQRGLAGSLAALEEAARACNSIALSLKNPGMKPNAQVLLNNVAYHLTGRDSMLNAYIAGEVLLPTNSMGVMNYDPRSMEKDLSEAIQADAAAMEFLMHIPGYVEGMSKAGLKSVIPFILLQKRAKYDAVKISNENRGFGHKYTVISFQDEVGLADKGVDECCIAADAIEQESLVLQEKYLDAKIGIGNTIKQLERGRSEIAGRLKTGLKKDLKNYAGMLLERKAELDKFIEDAYVRASEPYAANRASISGKLHERGLNVKSVEALDAVHKRGDHGVDFLKKIRNRELDFDDYKTRNNISLGPVYHSIKKMGDDQLAEVAALAKELARTSIEEGNALRAVDEDEIVRSMKGERSSVDEGVATIERAMKNVSDEYVEELLEGASPDENRPRFSTAELYE